MSCAEWAREEREDRYLRSSSRECARILCRAQEKPPRYRLEGKQLMKATFLPHALSEQTRSS